LRPVWGTRCEAMALSDKAIIGIALVFFLKGCGNSNSAKTSESQATGQNQGPAKVLSVGPPPPGRPVRGFSGRATVVLDKDAGVMKVAAWCRGTKGHSRVDFILTRYPLTDPTRRPIQNPGHVTRIATGPGVGPSPARCRPYHKGLACGGSAHGAARLDAVVSVPASTSCSRGVSVVTQFDDTCGNEACAGALTTYRLFAGRPRGC
jgi:hypothetical protein